MKELLKTNLANLGEVRLSAKPLEHLLELQRLMRADLGEAAPKAEPGDKGQVVQDLLRMKALRAKRGDKKKDEPPPPPLSAPERWRRFVLKLNVRAALKDLLLDAEEEAKEDDERENAAPDPILRPLELRICSFNALKLRLSNPKTLPDGTEANDGGLLLEHWAALAELMATFEIIVLQEVPGNAKKREEAVSIFHELLSRATEKGKSWSYVHSIPAGVGGVAPASGQTDTHAAFVKQGLDIEACTTWTHAKNRDGVTEVPLDYCPLMLLIRDKREGANRQRFVVTSVHLPPVSRRRDRDLQLPALLQGYGAQIRGCDAFAKHRISAPPEDARQRGDERVLHVIAGDFNVYPGATEPPEQCDGSTPDPREAKQTYGLSAAGFVATVPECTATSSGLKNYDNVLVDHYTDSRYVCYSSVLRLAMQHKNSGPDKKKGISDHNPVVFTFQYSQGVKRSANR
jgi:endonuclease/exonuclease/phosphatase family metal-dependent hydrolase